MELDKIIVKLREGKNISQAQLAKKLGVQRSTICLYESGKRLPSYDILINLADYFNVSIDYLLGRDSASSVDNELRQRPNYELSEKFASEYAELLKDESFIETVKLYNAITAEQRAVCIGCIATVLERLGVPVNKILGY